MKKQITKTIFFLSIVCFCQNQTFIVKYRHKIANPIISVEKIGMLQVSNKEIITKFTFLDSKEAKEDSVILSRYGDSIKLIGNTRINNNREYYFDFNKDSLYSKLFAPNDRKMAIVKESIYKPKWDLIDEYKTIGKYKCQKAKAKINDRIYYAYFTKEIALSAGPWRIFGLPGLVIEAYDEDRKYSFFLESIQNSEYNSYEKPMAERIITFEQYKRIKIENSINHEKSIQTMQSNPKSEIKVEYNGNTNYSELEFISK